MSKQNGKRNGGGRKGGNNNRRGGNAKGGNRKGGNRKGGGKGKGKGKRKGKIVIDSTAAALGAKLARNSGLQGISLIISNVLHAFAVLYVAKKLGPSDLGSYTLLLFLSGSITQVFHLFSKPGTLRRVFGQADDDDAGAEGDFDTGDDADVQSATPQKSLGIGIVWVALLGLIGAGLTILLRAPIAQVLLGGADSSQQELILWAGILGGVGAIFKLTEIIIWFEGRGWTYVIVDAMRPTLNLVFMAYLISKGRGVEGAIMGATIGTSIAVLVSVVVLVRSFELGFEFREVGLIVQRGIGRMPIAMSMFTIQNADGFLLSRFVDHAQLGQYQFAQKLGFIVSFLPQGFRIALRPLRKTAMFQAVRDQYGSAVAKGQLLIYFVLIAILAILAMVLGGELLISTVGGSKYEAAAPLIPLTAAMMTMPALFRTVNGQSFFPHKRAYFIGCVIFAALSFVGWLYLLVPQFGIIGTPIASLLGFGIPSAFLFIKNQRGKGKIEFRYGAVLGAIGLAAVLSVFNAFIHPSDKWLQLIEIIVLLNLWLIALPLTGIVPKQHRRALLEIGKGFFRRGPQGFDRHRGLKALTPKNREKLRRAIVDKIPVDVLVAAAREGPSDDAVAGNGAGASHNGGGGSGRGGGRTALLTRRTKTPVTSLTNRQAAHLVQLLRRVGRKGGMQLQGPSEFDARIAKFVFGDAPTAARSATMRSLTASGADSKDLHKLEDLSNYLSKAPKRAWDGRRRRRRVPVKVPVKLRRS